MGILSGNPKDEPMHYGEIFGVWEYSMAAKIGLSSLHAYTYHAGDKDLKEILRDMMEHTKTEMAECDELLMNNGITPAPALPKRTEAKLEDIPVGARFSDQEIAAGLTAALAGGLVTCSQMMSMSIREDVGALFAKYHAVKTTFSLRMLRMSKEKGWLIPPPLQVKRPDLVEV